MNETVSLYRFFNTTNELLYIGISNRVPRRLDEHHDDKPWYLEITRVEVEHHPNRGAALAAEKTAIKAERPKYNVVHNRGGHRVQTQGAGRWVFHYRRSGVAVRTDLWLYPELECSAMVDDVHELDGQGQFEEYVQYLEQRHSEWLKADAVPVIWSVHNGWDRSVFEAAPFTAWGDAASWGNFLAHYTWPEDAHTGEPLDWYALPVINDRFPEFAKALGWTPSPLQPTCPLTSLVRSRCGHYPIPLPAAA